MKPKWFFVISCVAALVVHAHASVVPSEDTFVLAEPEEKGLETSEPVTADPDASIILTEMRVNSEVSLRYAHTTVVTRVQNPARRAQQMTFHVILPETAFISGFVMTLSGKTYKAYVKGKEEAKRIYNYAVSHGMAAAHISARVRDSNHFTVSVNVEPKSEGIFNLTYEELLVRRNGVYKHAINLYPGTIVPKMVVTIHIKESQKISVLKVPAVSTGNEIDALENDIEYSNPLQLNLQKSKDEKEATVSFTPDREEQMRLMKIYADKTKQSAFSLDNWHANQSDDDSNAGILGQFVVLYDVERPENGEILVNDGYFVHFFTPPTLKPLSKHVVFVLDTSGSMGGRKIDQLRDAMRTILDDLKPNDFFNIVEFNTRVKVHKISVPVKKPSKHLYNVESIAHSFIASPENIAKAKIAVSRLSARGGTNIYEALDVAVDIINKNNETDQTDSTTAIAEADTVEKKDNLQPIIIFLTDGDATVGETNKEDIINDISEKNSVGKKASIYSLAFGQEADRDLLRKLSVHNDGFMRHIYEAADAELQLKYFYRQVTSPLLSDANFIYPPEQIKEGSVTKHKFRTVFMGSELVVAGEVMPDVSTLAPQMHAFCANDIYPGWKRYEIKNEVAVTEKKEHMPLERLWAYLTIKQLLEERDIKKHDKKDPNSPEKRALDIALKYEFVTPLTSLVVVKPNDTNIVDAESVHKIPSYRHRFGISSPVRDRGSIPIGIPPWRPYGSIPIDISPRKPYDPIRNGPIIPLSPYVYQSSSFGVESSKFGAPRNLSHQSPPPYTTPAPKPITQSLKGIYYLKDNSWAFNLFNSETNSLEFWVNGKYVTLELSKFDVPPKDITDSECTQSVSTANSMRNAGVCVYITRCGAVRNITPESYRNTYCLVQNKYAGICCPKNGVDNVTFK